MITNLIQGYSKVFFNATKKYQKYVQIILFFYRLEFQILTKLDILIQNKDS